MTQELSTLVAQFKTLTTEISKDDATSGTTWSDYLDRGVKLCEHLPDLESISSQQLSQLAELENLAVGVWNFSVALKTKGIVTPVSNAKIRHIAFWISEYCGQKVENEIGLKRQVMMGLKTSRAWLDGSVAEFAEKVLSKTEKCLQRLQKWFLDKTTADGVTLEALDRDKLEAEQDLFTLHCYKAETYVTLNRAEEALEQMMQAKELLPKFPKEASFLSILCYNTGVELYQHKQLSQAAIWLRESYELGKGKQSIGPKNQARTLRLLANLYLEDNPDENLQNALNAVSLANTEHCHPAGLYLKLKILLLQNSADNVIKRVAEELLKVPELTVDLSLHTLQLIHEQKRMEMMTWLIEELLKRFEHSPEIGKLLITNTEVLVQSNMNKEAKEFVEYCITAHHSGRPLDFSIKKRFHVLLWEQAAEAYEAEDFEEAFQWYNYSLSLYTQADPGDLNLAKLHRNRANCLIALGQLDKAKEAIEQSVKFDSSSPHTHFILFRLALLGNDNAAACESLKKLCELASKDQAVSGSGDNDAVSSLVALAAQQALETDKAEAACVALEYLTNNSTSIDQVLKALRCLIRLKLTIADQLVTHRNESDETISFIRTGYNKLLHLQDTDPTRKLFVQNEANWFMKIAWNLALQCEEEPAHMKELYTLCSQLLSLDTQDDSSQSRQMTCMLMSAAACLQIARSSSEEIIRRNVLEECLEHVSDCRELSNRIREHSIGASDVRSRETDTLLLLYEFEARIHLKDPAVEKVLERALTMAGPDPKSFEALAAIAIEPPTHNKSVCVRALKVAIRKNLQIQQPDIVKCSKLFHSLIQLCLSGGSAQDIAGKQEAWNYYMEIIDLLDKVQGQYPEMEIVWLMTKAWNCGINFYSCNKYEDAEKWCSMSMRMLKYLDTFRSNYQDHMSSVYGDILAKVETSSDRKSVET